MKSAWFRVLGIFVFALVLITAQTAPASADGWYWLGSDSKYSKYFDPTSVVTVRSVTTSQGKDVATEINAWTKTTYSPEGAQETIENYGLTHLIRADQLASGYSMALVQVNPQNRTVQYLREDFYDAQGTVLWSKVDGRVKEINSQQFDEDFYGAIVDQVFRQGEMTRIKAKDRWITLWENTDSNGNVTQVTGDTSTMRMKGKNMFLWTWQEKKDSNGNVTEIQFTKRAVNLPQGTERIIRGEAWTPSAGWQTLTSDTATGRYYMIDSSSPAFAGLTRLRAYSTGYSTWVNRYRIDL